MPEPWPRVRRGDVWNAMLDPVVGHEQAGTRPVIVLSNDAFNVTQAQLVAVVPLTRRIRPIPSHFRVEPPEGGLTAPSAALCEQMRFLSIQRFVDRRGRVTSATLEEIAIRLRYLLQI